MSQDEKTAGGKNLLAMTLWSWARVYGAPIDAVGDPAAKPEIDKLQTSAPSPRSTLGPGTKRDRRSSSDFLTASDLTAREPCKSLLAENTVGPLPPSIPIFIAQGDVDTVIGPNITRAYWPGCVASAAA